MKRLFAFFICLCVLFVGCKKTTSPERWQPSRASAEIEPYARRAIEIIDEYLAFKMTSEEATKAFRELYERIEPLNITGVSSEYNDPDKTIDHSIDILAIGQAKDRTDTEYRQHRDVLAFQIGEPVSGMNYDAERSVLDEGSHIGELIDLDSIPFDFGSMRVKDDFWLGQLCFDGQNGVRISDLQQYIETTYSSLVEKDIKAASISFYYSHFDQNIFYVSVDVRDGIFTGSVQRADSKATEALSAFVNKYTTEEIIAMKEYPKEFSVLNPLYEFDSIENLPEALAVASAFAGVE